MSLRTVGNKINKAPHRCLSAVNASISFVDVENCISWNYALQKGLKSALNVFMSYVFSVFSKALPVQTRSYMATEETFESY